MVVKLYADLLSQPARAVTLFLKKNNIPHELRIVHIAKGEHKSPDYVKNVHRFGKIPAIDDDGVKLIESIAILRYLARKYNTPDHWYPKDILKQAKVDEFLEWHHTGLRMPLVLYLWVGFLGPFLSGKVPNQDKLKDLKVRMDEALDLVENIWLEKSPYLTGDQISIADLIGISEIEQPRMVNYDVTTGRPKLKAWMKRVSDDLQPHYGEVIQYLNRFIEKNKSKM